MVSEYHVYILASKRNGTLYIGVTSHLIKRIYEHKNDMIDGFSHKYRTHDLVYFERHTDVRCAILREKQIKKWNRAWKIRLIEHNNPEWIDLYDEITGSPPPRG